MIFCVGSFYDPHAGGIRTLFTCGNVKFSQLNWGACFAGLLWYCGYCDHAQDRYRLFRYYDLNSL